MASSPGLRSHLSIGVATIILFACAATGMLTGTLAHALANNHSAGPTGSGPLISGTAPAGVSSQATMTPLATETPVAVSAVTNFTLTITPSSRTLSPGDTFTVTVLATANGAPVEGLPCSLRAPVSGPPGLFTTWPAPAITDASGQAVWTFTAPSVAPGSYGIEVDAVGGHNFEFHRYTTVRIT